MKEVVSTTYMAFDGKIFLTKEDCMEYESTTPLITAFKRVKLYIGNLWTGEDLVPIPEQILINYYTTNGKNDTGFYPEEICMVKISSDISQEEIELLEAFFELVANESRIYIENISAGMAIFWDEDCEEWLNMYRYIEQLEEKISRFRQLTNF